MERNIRIQNTRDLPLRWRAALMVLALIVLTISASSLRLARGSELSAAQKEYLKKLDEPVVLRGDYFKAINVAYADYSKTLAGFDAKSKIADGQRATTLDWLSHIENYDIHVEQTNATFIVYFPPTVRGDAPIIMGGIAEYEIDRKTFQIISKSTGK
jgi:hypothetical protein